ncbi:MAG: MogA/MoaB family molybdenum cofactor biosynthesis protein, partial [Methanoregula sp.]|nr:MogA/MoaB family molybdenum cofactor biosynthesis protein [Methanoregula sp.]
MNQNHIQPIQISAAIITVSSTRTKENDTSGATISTMFREVNIPINHYEIVSDRVEAIRNELYIAMKTTNCIIINGGTGLTHDDCTIEAISPLLEKKIDGFGEFFRMKSLQEIGTASMLSRAIAGNIDGKVIFCIPGSTPA